VTRANFGLGKEATKHFVHLNAAKVIAAVRSAAKGTAVVAEIEAETWELGYRSYASVKKLCAKVAEVERVDTVILNAGVETPKFEVFEEDESTITIECDKQRLSRFSLCCFYFQHSAIQLQNGILFQRSRSRVRHITKLQDFPNETLQIPSKSSIILRQPICPYALLLQFSIFMSLQLIFNADTKSRKFYKYSLSAKLRHMLLRRSHSLSSTPSAQVSVPQA
jgi:hypothetical protein